MMRKLPFALFVTGTLVACGSSPGAGGGGGGDDDSNPPDASMPGPDPNAAFEVISKDAMLQPGDQVTYCYYFHTSNTTDVLINKWVSDMSPGSHHAILFLNPGATGQPADGTLDPNGNCGGLNGTQASVWTYATQTEHQEEDLPTDDGAGKPLAQKIAANTPAVLQLHYLNASDQPISAHIDLKAYALPAGTPFTQTDAYVTYNQDIKIAPHAVGKSFTASCDLPAGVQFWTMSTHSHKQSVMTVVDDGANAIFTSTDWQHPGSMNWMATPFYKFTNSKLTWTCTYDNTGDNAANEVDSGTSAATDEMCMATGYFFPSTGPKFNVQYMNSCFSL
jgi:hypothetical protein